MTLIDICANIMVVALTVFVTRGLAVMALAIGVGLWTSWRGL